jgi:acetyl esterase/lipase
MNQVTPRHPMSERRVLYTMPGIDAVTVRRHHPYRVSDAGELTMDIYYPPDSNASSPRPAVLFVTGFSDRGAQKMLGSTFKDMGAFVSWAQLAAASGLVGVTYTNDVAGDVEDALRYVLEHAQALGVDRGRIGLWAGSGHAPNALSVLMQHGHELRCAALAYPYTLDCGASTGVAAAGRQFGFVTLPPGRSTSELPRDLPLFVARAGRDEMPGLNEALDRFVSETLALNLPVTVVNHSAGPHAFDLVDDSGATRDVVRQMLVFLRYHLAAE